MAGAGAMRSGGAQNLYGGKDLKNFFGNVKGQGKGQGGSQTSMNGPVTSAPQNRAPQTNTDPRTSKASLHQKSTDLDTLYQDAKVAQEELSDATRSIAQNIGGEPLIPPGLKGRERTQEKIQADYEGDPSRITDLARSSIICENPQQVYQALGQLESQFKTVRIKDRFKNPMNGYRDILVNLEMSNGHIVEVQLHLRSVMEVKNGAGHKLYEESRKIDAQAKIENRPLTSQERAKRQQLKQQQKLIYDRAYENSLQPGNQAALPEQELGKSSREEFEPNKTD
jgi:hypothetical protein